MIKSEFKYYSLENILKFDAHYNIIFGERSNGKTYACLYKAIENYVNNKGTTAYLRRYQEDFKGKRGAALFQSLVANDVVSKLTCGIFDGISYYAGKWYLSKFDEKLNKPIKENFPFCYGFSLSDMEHDKSTAYPTITTIIFDEFISRHGYLIDEFVTFMNCISTIVRQRDNVKIFMLGNTVNQYCPYFDEFGLTHINEMAKGDIDCYSYGKSVLKVAVEYTDSIAESKPSDLYFAFDNPKLSMITSGDWEMGMYPHLPYKFNDNDIVFTFFIVFKRDIIQAEIINHNSDLFIFCHRKTTPLKSPDNDLIYTLEYSPKPNHCNSILRGGILIKNDTFSIGILPLLKKYCVLLTENHISIRQAIINARALSIISANDDKTKVSADIFLKKMVDGELSAIAEQPFFDGIKSFDVSNSLPLRQLIETEQYLKAAMYHELGIDYNANLKKSVISSFEAALENDFLLPLVDNFYENRKLALNKFNQMYNLSADVQFNSTWLTNQLENKREQEIFTQSLQESKISYKPNSGSDINDKVQN